MLRKTPMRRSEGRRSRHEELVYIIILQIVLLASLIVRLFMATMEKI